MFCTPYGPTYTELVVSKLQNDIPEQNAIEQNSVLNTSSDSDAHNTDDLEKYVRFTVYPLSPIDWCNQAYSDRRRNSVSTFGFTGIYSHHVDRQQSKVQRRNSHSTTYDFARLSMYTSHEAGNMNPPDSEIEELLILIDERKLWDCLCIFTTFYLCKQLSY